MRKITTLCVIAAISCASVKAQRMDSLYKAYDKLAASKDEKDQAYLKAELYKHLQSNKETDWQLAANTFYRLNKKDVVDSITKAEKKKFPAGLLVREDYARLIYDQKDPVKKEAMYHELIKRFPPAKFGQDNRITYDYVRNAIGTAYADVDSVAKAVKFANMIETPAWKAEGSVGVARVLANKGHFKEAEMLMRKAIDTANSFRTTRAKEQGAQFAALGYRSYNALLARILYDDKNYEESLKYAENAYKAYKESDEVNGEVMGIYSKALIALGRDKEAFEKIDEAVRAGQGNESMKAELKTLYTKVKGNEGYDAYMAELNRQLVAKIKKDLTKQMINTPAPDFTLTDLNGKNVSLSELKGKIVVLDFWATWCGPCKRSFPVMKQAVERYQKDNDVQFLFIHTWERDDKAVADTKKFIADHSYPFEVLMDLNEHKAATAYKVSSIPAKFVIDKEGNIRFKFSGFSGGEDAALEEISAMISLIRG
ncbi:TlpA disulfide reductase family protein [Chitinophaga sp.]|uniref:TlpA disulfide reductase family protein n=1 Tax=Chitinophaga sp. TaxID=1869181 RepID=UPI0031D8C520